MSNRSPFGARVFRFIYTARGGASSLAFAAGVACGIVGCSILVDTNGFATAPDSADANVSELPDGRGEAGNDASPTDAASNADSNAGPCPGGGPAMVRVLTAERKPYCIDSTEVTQGQYLAFVDVATPADFSTPECAWNDSFVPPPTCFDPEHRPNHPVACVDWCDAQAFCAWAGKRLCGKIGGGSARGVLDPEWEWTSACSDRGLRTYAYGANYVAGNCNDSTDAGAQPVASFPKCVGGVDGLFDMSGNVAEWIDRCDSDAPDSPCNLVGGMWQESDPSVDPSVLQDEAHLRCSARDVGHPARYFGDPSLGFRCCRDALE
ncbi:pyoverdine responsive serine/threonine kinase [Labilithrix luteola]|uniref:Pyoverdine responsive serine/threonine kinase n=1 Tax=Labilithrix luteola TaxID=1391654 RepID=A0A0K1PRH1_9BACT|nr:SUMF1/EgtB/PvdO family nonheme iron enzyme [Labilithrix luteola]AKU96145.1 pyoverdine responsive serine/threonine kinase [Labilithrix luteola]